ncbi:MAG: hypothetical protein ACXWCP_25085 [Burkholderiales bacterium]
MRATLAFIRQATRRIFDGMPYIELKHDHITRTDAAGVSTKAGGFALLDDFTYGCSAP